MRKAKLIGEEATWQQLNYSRCGRTDKGVSAAGQVMHTFRLFDCRLCLRLLCYPRNCGCCLATLPSDEERKQACKHPCSGSASTCSFRQEAVVFGACALMHIDA